MGNPCRWHFNNEIWIRKPEIDEAQKQLKITFVDEDQNYSQYYETAVVDFYSAPDVILHYSNGNTCKDEWRRYGRWEFKGLRWVQEHKAYPMSENNTSIIFTFEDIAGDNCESIAELDIPLGKFKGMTPEQVENYKRKNFIKFKDYQPRPSKEALLAAYKVPLSQPLSEPEIEKILMAAYAIDF